MALSNGHLCRSLPVNQLLQQIIGALDEEWIDECRTLWRLLQSPHLQALLSVTDVVARQAYDLDNLEHILQVMTGESAAKEKSTKTTLLYKDPPKAPDRRRKAKPRQKVVNVFKSQEPLGVTVRFDEQTGDIALARVLVGGAAYRSGLVNVGDRILEVNGIPLRGRSHLDVINILQRECLKSMISFRIVVLRQTTVNNGGGGRGGGGDEGDGFVRSSMYIVRAHFDYNPASDSHIPCNSIGLSFSRGSILTVLNRDDPEWWQACMEQQETQERTTAVGSCKRRMEVFTIAGLIPSSHLQERRTVAIRELKSHLDRYRYIHILGGLLPTPFRKAKWSVQKVRKVMYGLEECSAFDREEIATYEPVGKYLPEGGHFRPVVLIGPSGVGCSTLIQLMICRQPGRYREPLLHTSRYRRFAEADGLDYYFVREQWMEREISRGNFVIFYKLRGNYYGLHKSTIRAIMEEGHVCLFQMKAQFLRLIYTAEFKPYVIFIRPPWDIHKLVNSRLSQAMAAYGPFIGGLNGGGNGRKTRARLEYEMHLMIYEAHRINYLYGHKFDSVLVNEDLGQTFHLLSDILVSVENEPKWVPLSWISKPSCR